MLRVIQHGDGHEDRLEGSATFSRSGPKLIMDEVGTLKTRGQTLAAKQRYIWEDGTDHLNVYFSDLRPFHMVTLRDPHPTAIHLCDPDRYEVSYDFSAWPEWHSSWRVEGPRKDYQMMSHYRRETR